MSKYYARPQLENKKRTGYYWVRHGKWSTGKPVLMSKSEMLTFEERIGEDIIVEQVTK